MGKQSVTASAVISFSEKLESDSSKFYEKLAEIYERDKETFLAFAKEGKKNTVLITRTYQETISDALEAGFSFKGLNLKNYLTETTLTKRMNYSSALETAIELEEKASKFYLDLVKCSNSLLATIPKAFKKVAERRSNRKLKLKILLDKSKRNDFRDQ